MRGTIKAKYLYNLLRIIGGCSRFDSEYMYQITFYLRYKIIVEVFTAIDNKII